MFSHSSVGGHLSCFHLEASLNKPIVNVFVYVLGWADVFNSSEYIPSSGSSANFLFNFSEKLLNCFSILSVLFLHSEQQCPRVPISIHPAQHLLLFIHFYYNYPCGCKTVSHCGFVYLPLRTKTGKLIFHVLISYL